MQVFSGFCLCCPCRQRRDVDLRDLLAVSVEAAVLGGKEVGFLKLNIMYVQIQTVEYSHSHHYLTLFNLETFGNLHRFTSLALDNLLMCCLALIRSNMLFGPQ